VAGERCDDEVVHCSRGPDQSSEEEDDQENRAEHAGSGRNRIGMAKNGHRPVADGRDLILLGDEGEGDHSQRKTTGNGGDEAG
jgi:hypothetical protein